MSAMQIPSGNNNNKDINPILLKQLIILQKQKGLLDDLFNISKKEISDQFLIEINQQSPSSYKKKQFKETLAHLNSLFKLFQKYNTDQETIYDDTKEIQITNQNQNQNFFEANQIQSQYFPPQQIPYFQIQQHQPAAFIHEQPSLFHQQPQYLPQQTQYLSQQSQFLPQQSLYLQPQSLCLNEPQQYTQEMELFPYSPLMDLQETQQQQYKYNFDSIDSSKTTNLNTKETIEKPKQPRKKQPQKYEYGKISPLKKVDTNATSNFSNHIKNINNNMSKNKQKTDIQSKLSTEKENRNADNITKSIKKQAFKILRIQQKQQKQKQHTEKQSKQKISQDMLNEKSTITVDDNSSFNTFSLNLLDGLQSTNLFD